MTHTLHRRGNKESLKNDFIVLAKAANGINDKGAAPKLRSFMRMALKNGACNIGHPRAGNMYGRDVEEVIAKVPDPASVTVVFDDQNALEAFLKELKKADLGISVVISGLFDISTELCANLGIVPHTIEHSLGILGRSELLASEQVLENTTMCGHGMISPSLVKYLVDEIKSGRMSAKEASIELAKPCQCGILNPTRAKELLVKMATEKS